MIFCRITEHVRGQNRFAVDLDFMIVVVGVFIDCLPPRTMPDLLA